jgi:hypothetical protein
MFRRLALATVGMLILASTAAGQGRCGVSRKPTLRNEVEYADLIVLGTAHNPRRIRLEGSKEEKELTDIRITEVCKPHAAMGFLRVFPINHLIEVPDKKNPPKLLIFCEVNKGVLWPYKGVVVESAAVVDYLKSVALMKGQPRELALRFYFAHLDHKERVIAADAFQEVAEASRQDLRTASPFFSAEKLRQLLKEKNVPPARLDLYGYLLGLCGHPRDAALLRPIVDDMVKKDVVHSRILASYTMLLRRQGKPKECLEYIKAVLGNPKADYLQRYEALKAVRLLWDELSDIVSRKELVGAVALLLEHRDMADFAIEDFRRRGQWQMTRAVLDLADRKSHQVRVIRWSVLRFALRSPGPRAAQYVLRERMRDREWVEEVEEILRLESP